MRAPHDLPPHAVAARLDRARRGAAAEVLAARHLRRSGLEVLARNVRCRGGEIDLLCREGELLVIVEVRMRERASARRGAHDYGGALGSVSARKRRALLRAARYILLRTPALRSMRVRFDVIGIERHAGGTLELSWIRDAFRPAAG
ncbi:MAG TPA: YraN family protein [Steroidobacteraceae bacterium]|nr:YraN family protein [Steroidobacteraceae bacterium]